MCTITQKTLLFERSSAVQTSSKIVLSGSEMIAYKAICRELAERSEVLRIYSINVEDACFCDPQMLPYRARYNKYTKCLVTGEKIFNRDKAVIIFYHPFGSKRIILGVIKDKETFKCLLSYGNLAALRASEREKRDRIAGKLPPRPVPVIEPHQQICFCVQCGTRIVRPLEMGLDTFGKVYRCQKCSEGKKSMKLGEQRYCRTCGTSFTPTELKDRSVRLCPWCRRG
ncbi:MAG: hypothetical protein CEN87_312 [Parcubacteria group bacterium Licking1014_1]|nr:MAG: hypothetical protein CEN87_312 [Parcubacteria group bacterium Licking1014_1]